MSQTAMINYTGHKQTNKVQASLYIGSLYRLNLPFSGDSRHLPEQLRKTVMTSDDDFSDPSGNKGKKELVKWLEQFGYVFFTKESLLHNVRIRIQDLMEQYRSENGVEAFPRFLDGWIQSRNDPRSRFLRTFLLNDGEVDADEDTWSLDEVISLADPADDSGFTLLQVEGVYDRTFCVAIIGHCPGDSDRTDRQQGSDVTDRTQKFEVLPEGKEPFPDSRAEDTLYGQGVYRARMDGQGRVIVTQPAPNGMEAVRRVRERYLAGEVETEV